MNRSRKECDSVITFDVSSTRYCLGGLLQNIFHCDKIDSIRISCGCSVTKPSGIHRNGGNVCNSMGISSIACSSCSNSSREEKKKK